jgi:hypothetical protein
MEKARMQPSVDLHLLAPGMIVQVTEGAWYDDYVLGYAYEEATWQAVIERVEIIRGDRYIHWTDGSMGTWASLAYIETVEGPLTERDTETVDSVLYGWIWE